MRDKIIFVLNRYKYFLLVLIILVLVIIFKNDIGIKSLEITKDSLFQMLSVLPPIMILLGLMDEWVSRESMMKYMGENSGILGVFLVMSLATFAAGPMYAAFPFTAVLLKKGVKFSNVMIFMNTWCVIKISTLLFEVTSLGFKFTFYRFIIDFVGVIVMGYLIDYVMKKEDKQVLYSQEV